MGDWQDLGQTIIIGLIFSFLVAKLIATVVSFKEDNLRIVRDEDLRSAPNIKIGGSELGSASISNEETSGDREEAVDSLTGESLLGDEDDWEGIESTELDEEFSAATTFVAATAADRISPKVTNDVQLQLYGLYKIATEGPCTSPQPSALKIAARAKWNAWQKLGAMPPEEAMQKYILIVDGLYPSWADGSTVKNKESTSGGDSAAKGTMGPVFSSYIYEEESANDLKLDALHICAREGEADDLLKHISDGVSVNLRDSEGRTPLHWAVDRGHLNIVEILLNSNADVNAKDNEGQTPLHYAVLCERPAIAGLLVKHHADVDVKDDEGNTATDLGGSSWSFPASD